MLAKTDGSLGSATLPSHEAFNQVGSTSFSRRRPPRRRRSLWTEYEARCRGDRPRSTGREGHLERRREVRSRIL